MPHITFSFKNVLQNHITHWLLALDAGCWISGYSVLYVCVCVCVVVKCAGQNTVAKIEFERFVVSENRRCAGAMIL